MSLKSTILASVGSLIVGASAVVAPAIASEDFRTTMGINTTDKAIILEQEETIKDQRIEMQSIEEARKTLLAEKTTLQTKVEDLTVDKQALSIQVLNLEKQKTDLQSSLTNKENELNTTKASLTAKETELANANKDLNTLNSTLAEKETLLEEKQTALDNAIANGELQAEEIANKQVEITNLQTNISTLNTQKTELENTVENLRNNVRLLTNMKNNLENQVDTLTVEKQQVENDYNTTKEEYNQLLENYNSVQNDLVQANARIEELEKTTPNGDFYVTVNAFDAVCFEFGSDEMGWYGNTLPYDDSVEMYHNKSYDELNCLMSAPSFNNFAPVVCEDIDVYETATNAVVGGSLKSTALSEYTNYVDNCLTTHFVDINGNQFSLENYGYDTWFSVIVDSYTISEDGTMLDITFIVIPCI